MEMSERGVWNGKPDNHNPWFPLYQVLKLSRQLIRLVLSSIHLVLWSMEHSNAFPSVQPPKKGVTTICSSRWKNRNSWPGVGKRGGREGTQAMCC